MIEMPKLTARQQQILELIQSATVSYTHLTLPTTSRV